jgi:acetoin utilization protein AcuB
MLVGDLMTPTPITITAEMSVPVALQLMHEKRIRRLPILDSHDRLIGIVSEQDLLYASPSPATSLNIWEIKELLAKVKVETIMTRKVLTVSEETPVEEAARIMADEKIGSLPVMRDGKITGIITNTDLFNAFLAMLGGRRPGVRITAFTSGAKGTVARITNAIYGLGGDIVGLGFNEVTHLPDIGWQITLKVQDVPLATLVEVIKPLVIKIIDAREI